MTKVYPEFFDNAEFPWTRKVLEDHWREVRAELDGLTEGAFGSWPRYHVVQNQWNLFPLLTPGREFPDNQARCPKTTELLRRIPGLTMATFSWLRPQSAILPHVGFSTIVLRAHLALKVPKSGDFGFRCGTTTRKWEEGRVMVFDDMHNHEAWNRTDEERVVLMMDFKRPWKYRTSTLGYFRQKFYIPESYKRSYDRVAAEAAQEVDTVDPRAAHKKSA